MKETSTFLIVGLICLLAFDLKAQDLIVTHLGTYATGKFDEGAAEIVAHDPGSQRLYCTNADDNSLDIIDFKDPANMTLIKSVSLSPYGDGINSVSVSDGLVAVAVEATTKTDSGRVVLLDTNGQLLAQFTVGALPDMITFSPDGTMLITANEGEPNDDYSIDPYGSVSIISINETDLTNSNVTTLDFSGFNISNIDADVRIKNGTTVAEDLEPEYVAVNPSSTRAFVTLQENNAFAIIDLINKSIIDVVALGYKDHGLAANKLDASDRGNAVDFRNFPHLYGMYMPDAVASIDIDGTTYYITANEGDGREYDTYEDEVRVKDLELDSVVFPNADILQLDTILGRLTVSAVDGDIDNDGDMDELFVFGGRSFSIWDDQGNLIYDSGDQIEMQTYAALPEHFNATNDDNDSFKNRSDNKGPEPEAAVVFTIGETHFAAIGLERIGGFMIYDISDPYAPVFLNYTNRRNFNVAADSNEAGDLGPEDIIFIAASESPTRKNLLVVSNEISGTVSAFELSGYNLDQVTGVDEPDLSGALKIYPNPATDYIYTNGTGDYIMYDDRGVEVIRVYNANRIDLKNLPDGTYLLHDCNSNSTQKIVKY